MPTLLPSWLSSAHARLVRKRPAVDALSTDAAVALVAEFAAAVRARDVPILESLMAPRFRATVLGRTRSGLRPVTLSRRRYVAYLRSLLAHDLMTYDIEVDGVLFSTPSQVKLSTSVHFPGNTEFRTTFPEPPHVEAIVAMFLGRPVFTSVAYVPMAPNNRSRGP